MSLVSKVFEHGFSVIHSSTRRSATDAEVSALEKNDRVASVRCILHLVAVLGCITFGRYLTALASPVYNCVGLHQLRNYSISFISS